MTDAIGNDVSTEEEIVSVDETTTEKRELSPREKMLNDIARQNAEAEGREYPEAADSTAEGDDTIAAEDLGETPTEDEGVSEEEPAQPQAALDPLEELGYYRKEDGKLYTKMKINGVEKEVPAAQVKAYIQKDLAGDYKLQQAAEQERRLQEEMAKIERDRQDRLKQSLSQPSPMDADDIKEKAKSFIQKIYDGQEGAEDDLVAFMQSTRTTVDPDAIIQSAKAEMKSELERERHAEYERHWNQSVEHGNRALQESHPEIYQDQTLFGMVNNRTAEMVQAQQRGDPEYITLAPADIIAKAAVEVQEWLDSRANPKPSGNSRQSRKDGLKPMPNSLGTVNQKPKKPELDTSPTAAIERMKQTRAVF